MLSIASVKTETHARQVFVYVLLQNQGPCVVRPGTMFGRQTSREGAVHQVQFSNCLNIAPGGTARVSHLLAAMSELEFTGYRQSDGQIIPFSGGVVRRLSLFRSVEVVMMRWRDEVLLPGTRSVAVHFKAAQSKAWMRLADLHKGVQHWAQVVRIALEPLDAAIVRWRDEVLPPWARSVAVHFKAAQSKAWMRLADLHKEVQHWAQVVRIALEPFDAAIVRWRDEVLRPRLKSIAARTKETLYRLNGSALQKQRSQKE